ncbi:slipin family protein [Sediminitomix flava]|uniref:SPFH domain/Band 7 family protein n=1 Tax=Sediminitomix flava TaxID=379075 RepID=A0A315Z9D9_SEDFL|nr:slipin family protein [Sediminitomix flava]PWJ42175.1 SPFH domain/Band 7 family protein [Sediminitomix flava]
MKKVRINKGKIGLVYRAKDLNRVILDGVYWLSPFEQVEILEMEGAFKPSRNLNLYLVHEDLSEHLDVIEIKDQEIALRYENGVFKEVLSTTGKHAYWKGLNSNSFIKQKISDVEIPSDFDLNKLSLAGVFPFVRSFHIDTFEKGLLYVDGDFYKELGAGYHYFWKNAHNISLRKVDLRERQQEIVGQEILTKDKAALRINFTAQFKVTDIRKALEDNQDYEKQLYVLTQLALRAFVGSLTLDELLERKESISKEVLDSLKEKVSDLGVSLIDAGIKDIILPGEVKEIMKQVLVAQKQAQANIITRREETASTRSLLNTAKLMEDNQMLFKLKEMEYIEKIADKINTISVSGGNQVVDQLRDLFIRN